MKLDGSFLNGLAPWQPSLHIGTPRDYTIFASKTILSSAQGHARNHDGAEFMKSRLCDTQWLLRTATD